MGWKWQQKNSNDDRVSADISSYIKALYTGEWSQNFNLVVANMYTKK